VLGIDPGIGITGYGLVSQDSHGDIHLVDYGTIDTPPRQEIPLRLQKIYHETLAVIRKHNPDSAAIEKLLFGKNVTTAMAVGQARGVTVLALAECHLSITEYTPAIVKQSVAGYGNASKGQIQDMVKFLLNLEQIPRPDDAADALAVAITHIYSTRYLRMEEE
jgi:crossover junction endodeoxyribonuclease RuvC